MSVESSEAVAPRLLAICGLMLLAGASPSAQVFESVGTRALGMGGAFVAVADDATAAYWNPAGLPTGAFFSLLADQASLRSRLDPSRRDSAGANQAGTIVGMSTNTTALSYYRLRVNQIEYSPPAASLDLARNDQRGEATLQSFVTHNLALTGAQLLYPGVSVGTTLRYVRGTYAVGIGSAGSTTDAWLDEAADLRGRSQHNVDVDAGLKIGSQMLQVGVVVRNLLQPSLDGPDGRSHRVERHVRLGLAVRPIGGLLVAADVDLSRLATFDGHRRNVALGGEQWFGQWLGVRGGARVDLDGADDASGIVGAFGLSVALSSGSYFDAQLTRGRDERERGWSLAGRVGF